MKHPRSWWKKQSITIVSKKLRQEAITKETLQYLNKTICNIGKVHPVWTWATSHIRVAMATTKAKLQVQRYALSGTYSSGNNKKDQCHYAKTPKKHSSTSSSIMYIHLFWFSYHESILILTNFLRIRFHLLDSVSTITVVLLKLNWLHNDIVGPSEGSQHQRSQMTTTTWTLWMITPNGW